jgi:hypothetical protein
MEDLVSVGQTAWGQRVERMKITAIAKGRTSRLTMACKHNTAFNQAFFSTKLEDGAFQFQGKGLRDLTAFKVFAQFHRLFQGASGRPDRVCTPDMCFDIFAGGGVQFFVDILGKPFEQRNAVFVGMMRVSPFHNTLSMLF